ncbi:copper resistance protein CopC [Saccharopolyspora spinosporotrichia]
MGLRTRREHGRKGLSALPRTALLCVLSALGLVVLLPLPAAAHTALLESSPADGATLRQPPAEAWLRLSDPIDPNLVTVTLTGADGRQLPLPAPTARDTTLTQPLPHLDNDRYALAYRIVSADGHPVTGAISFTVDAPLPSTTPTPAPAPAGTPQPAADDGSAALWWAAAPRSPSSWWPSPPRPSGTWGASADGSAEDDDRNAGQGQGDARPGAVPHRHPEEAVVVVIAVERLAHDPHDGAADQEPDHQADVLGEQ